MQRSISNFFLKKITNSVDIILDVGYKKLAQSKGYPQKEINTKSGFASTLTIK